MKGFSNLDLDRYSSIIIRGVKSTWIEMKLGKIIKHIIGHMLEFYWNLLRIFLIEIFQKLEIGRTGFGGICQIF